MPVICSWGPAIASLGPPTRHHYFATVVKGSVFCIPSGDLSSHCGASAAIRSDSLWLYTFALSYQPCFRVQELCESRGGRPGLSILTILNYGFCTILNYGFCGRKATLNRTSALVTICP